MESGERKKSERKLVWRDRREIAGMERERPGREKEIRKWVNMIERERESAYKKTVNGLGEK